MFGSLSTAFLGFETDVETTVRLAREFGFQSVDLSGQQTAGISKADSGSEVRRMLEGNGIRPGCFTMTPLSTSGNEEEWRQGIAQLPELCRCASEAGFERALMVVLPYDQDLNYEANFERNHVRIEQVCRILQPHGIRLGLEYIAPLTRREGQPFSFIFNLAGALSLCAAVGSANLGVFLDCFHWYCAGETDRDISGLTDGQVVGVHICDAVAGRTVEEQIAFERELPCATGIIDISNFLGSLAAIGYAGPVSCEPMNQGLEALSLTQAVAQARCAMNQAMRGIDLSTRIVSGTG